MAENHDGVDECKTYERAKVRTPMDCGSLIPELDQAALEEIRARYPQKCVDCICYALNPAERRVIFFDPIPEMKDYCVFSRLQVMSEEEAEFYDSYDALPQYKSEFMRLNRNWVQREQKFLLENLIKTLGRNPTETELDAALAEEIGRPGKSHAERFRVYYAVAFQDRVHKVRKTKKEKEAEAAQVACSTPVGV